MLGYSGRIGGKSSGGRGPDVGRVYGRKNFLAFSDSLARKIC
jgi:hypothetical protein